MIKKGIKWSLFNILTCVNQRDRHVYYPTIAGTVQGGQNYTQWKNRLDWFHLILGRSGICDWSVWMLSFNTCKTGRFFFSCCMKRAFWRNIIFYFLWNTLFSCALLQTLYPRHHSSDSTNLFVRFFVSLSKKTSTQPSPTELAWLCRTKLGTTNRFYI